jgi:site-specific recombinase XerD
MTAETYSTVGRSNKGTQSPTEIFLDPRTLHPHLFRHQMLTYLTSKGLTDAQIQLISGHESKKSLEVYQHLSLESVDKAYQDAVQRVGI